ncbi:hypothetical protein RclHR1_09980009 [Rhizophagus clarus]|uniref:F-box domain-containing protein n=1 Tax=Rhizophagus clarus TaxID=94130 RepID=A0A2Z6SFX5_9GLOM|nr:hypothetical protein RclHR1_09980009 [Rhizophagus clarus]GES72752.1 hypothetical protein GLOIN_2v1877795 [Rhizophagus clarus]
MTCSKIFSGDLPELTYDILKFLHNDFSTLYSCVLVNRFWCRLAIPLLWEDPFSISIRNYKFIDIYLHNLNDDLKTKLNKYKIFISNILPCWNKLFNYPSFLKYLNLHEFIISLHNWFKDNIKAFNPELKFFLRDLSLNSTLEFKILVSASLIKIFIENEVNLHTLILEIDTSIAIHNKYYEQVFKVILQDTNFIKNILNLNLHTLSDNKNMLIQDHISQIINSHQNLKKIYLSYNTLPLYQSLLLSNDYNCSNTLNTIIFFHVDFNFLTNNIFDQLNVLESLHIIDCSNDNNIIQIINSSNKPIKLKSLFISRIPNIELLALLLQKSGDYLENCGFHSFDNSSLLLLIDLFMKYCKNIKFLDCHIYGKQIIYPIFNLIENNKQYLNYVSIYTLQEGTNLDIERSSIILQNLGQILPSKLEYLNLALRIKNSNFSVFLENSKNTFINKLLIMQKGEDDILHCIKKLIMKEKRVNYLAIWNNIFSSGLSHFAHEVKEFKLHNIKVQSYFDLYLDIRKHDTIKKLII